MSVADNKATYRRAIDALSAGDIDAVAGMLNDDYAWHGPGGAEVSGLTAWRGMMEGYLSAFPDLRIAVDDVIGEGDQLAARVTITGTHKGELEGIAATGKRIEITANAIIRFANGKFAEEWENFDEMAMMRQIGAIPAAAH